MHVYFLKSVALDRRELIVGNKGVRSGKEGGL